MLLFLKHFKKTIYFRGFYVSAHIFQARFSFESFHHIFLSSFGPSDVWAKSFVLPEPGQMLGLTESYTPALLSGITFHPDQPLNMDFIVDAGDSGLENDELKAEAQKMMNYFLTTLTVPDDEMWVNLSPYEENRIIADGLVQTEMGRDMLIQDYLLKQLSSSLMYPEGEVGKKFWDKVYLAVERSRSVDGQLGTSASLSDQIPDLFNKIWIVPEEASVHNNDVFVSNSKLKVMLESDYLAQSKDDSRKLQDLSFPRRRESMGHNDRHDQNIDPRLHGDDNNQQSATSNSTKELIKEILLPVIEQEVNEGKTFANLRQIYASMILGTWFKNQLRESAFGEMYFDQNKLNGIDLAQEGVKEEVYNTYVEAFKTGVYDYIREEYDPKTAEIKSRRYFSGGLENVNDVTVSQAMLTADNFKNPFVIQSSLVDLASLYEGEEDLDPDTEYYYGEKLMKGWEIQQLLYEENEAALERRARRQRQDDRERKEQISDWRERGLYDDAQLAEIKLTPENAFEEVQKIMALPEDQLIVLMVDTNLLTSNPAVINFLTSGRKNIVVLKAGIDDENSGVFKEFFFDGHPKAVMVAEESLNAVGLEVPENGVFDPNQVKNYSDGDRDALKQKIKAMKSEELTKEEIAAVNHLDDKKFSILKKETDGNGEVTADNRKVTVGDVTIYANGHIFDLEVLPEGAKESVIIRTYQNSPVIVKGKAKIIGVGPETKEKWGVFKQNAAAFIRIAKGEKTQNLLNNEVEGQTRLYVDGNDSETLEILGQPETWVVSDSSVQTDSQVRFTYELPQTIDQMIDKFLNSKPDSRIVPKDFDYVSGLQVEKLPKVLLPLNFDDIGRTALEFALAKDSFHGDQESIRNQYNNFVKLLEADDRIQQLTGAQLGAVIEQYVKDLTGDEDPHSEYTEKQVKAFEAMKPEIERVIGFDNVDVDPVDQLFRAFVVAAIASRTDTTYFQFMNHLDDEGNKKQSPFFNLKNTATPFLKSVGVNLEGEGNEWKDILNKGDEDRFNKKVGEILSFYGIEVVDEDVTATKLMKLGLHVIDGQFDNPEMIQQREAFDQWIARIETKKDEPIMILPDDREDFISVEYKMKILLRAGFNVRIGVSDGPVMNDTFLSWMVDHIAEDDFYKEYMDRLMVISTGVTMGGTPLDLTSQEFNNEFLKASSIVSNGDTNLEGVSQKQEGFALPIPVVTAQKDKKLSTVSFTYQKEAGESPILDAAELTHGGVDFDARKMDLQESGDDAQLQKMFDSLDGLNFPNFQGFDIQINGMIPLTPFQLNGLLGLNDSDQESYPEYSHQSLWAKELEII